MEEHPVDDPARCNGYMRNKMEDMWCLAINHMGHLSKWKDDNGSEDDRQAC